jgi:methionyl-tRNA formyltransferase
MKTSPNIAFFGTPDRAVIVLDALKAAGIFPSLIVTQPDRPQGRKLVMTPPPAKVWADKEKIKTLQPEDPQDKDFLKTLQDGDFDTFIVVAYGKILKKGLLNIPKRTAINLHASLLPRLRGSSPIETALLTDERNTGVSIIVMDELMDHGPILAQKAVDLVEWPLPADKLAQILVSEGAQLIIDILPDYLAGTVAAVEQDHSKATVAKKISKADGEIDLGADGYQNWLKFNAYLGWPTSYFFTEKDGKKTRVVITDAAYENGAFVIKKVIPEGKKEMPWSQFNHS